MFEHLKVLTTRLSGQSATTLRWRRIGLEARWAATVIAAEFGAAIIRRQRRTDGSAR